MVHLQSESFLTAQLVTLFSTGRSSACARCPRCSPGGGGRGRRNKLPWRLCSMLLGVLPLKLTAWLISTPASTWCLGGDIHRICDILVAAEDYPYLVLPIWRVHKPITNAQSIIPRQ
eukprot:3735289-Amphidinium_carterae.1